MASQKRLIFTPLVFNIYVHDLPSLTCSEYGYVNELALIHFAGNRKAFNRVLRRNITTSSAYFQEREMKLSETILTTFY